MLVGRLKRCKREESQLGEGVEFVHIHCFSQKCVLRDFFCIFFFILMLMFAHRSIRYNIDYIFAPPVPHLARCCDHGENMSLRP